MDIPGVAVTRHQIEQMSAGDIKGPPANISIEMLEILYCNIDIDVNW